MCTTHGLFWRGRHDDSVSGTVEDEGGDLPG